MVVCFFAYVSSITSVPSTSRDLHKEKSATQVSHLGYNCTFGENCQIIRIYSMLGNLVLRWHVREAIRCDFQPYV